MFGNALGNAAVAGIQSWQANRAASAQFNDAIWADGNPFNDGMPEAGVDAPASSSSVAGASGPSSAPTRSSAVPVVQGERYANDPAYQYLPSQGGYARTDLLNKFTGQVHDWSDYYSKTYQALPSIETYLDAGAEGDKYAPYFAYNRDVAQPFTQFQRDFNADPKRVAAAWADYNGQLAANDAAARALSESQFRAKLQVADEIVAQSGRWLIDTAFVQPAKAAGLMVLSPFAAAGYGLYESGQLWNAGYKKTAVATGALSVIGLRAPVIGTEIQEFTSIARNARGVVIAPGPTIGSPRSQIGALNPSAAPQHYDIVPYSTRAPGFEKHHGILDAWGRANVPNYSPGKAPTVVLTRAEHNATRAVFNTWRAEQGMSRTTIDWAQISAPKAHALTYRMFQAAKVPDSVTASYLRAFNRYTYGP